MSGRKNAFLFLNAIIVVPIGKLKNKTEDEMNKEKLIEILKTIMMIFIGIGILALMMWMVTLVLVATGS
jgi:fatty acid desaturase